MRRSFKIWLVVGVDYEGEVPIKAFTLKRDAEAEAARVPRPQPLLDRDTPGFPGGGAVRQVDLVLHDGANALTQHMLVDQRFKGATPL